MLSESCTFLLDALNAQIYREYKLPEDRVVLTNLVDTSGSPEATAQNKVVMSVVNMEHETTATNMDAYRANGNGGFGRFSPPLSLNMFLMFSANFTGKNYQDGLGYLNSVISFFQNNPVFDHQNSPQLSSNIQRLQMEFVNLKAHDLSHIWGALGSKYVPSVMYKVRMLTFQSSDAKDTAGAIGGTGSQGNATSPQ